MEQTAPTTTMKVSTTPIPTNWPLTRMSTSSKAPTTEFPIFNRFFPFYPFKGIERIVGTELENNRISLEPPDISDFEIKDAEIKTKPVLPFPFVSPEFVDETDFANVHPIYIDESDLFSTAKPDEKQKVERKIKIQPEPESIDIKTLQEIRKSKFTLEKRKEIPEPSSINWNLLPPVPKPSSPNPYILPAVPPTTDETHRPKIYLTIADRGRTVCTANNGLTAIVSFQAVASRFSVKCPCFF